MHEIVLEYPNCSETCDTLFNKEKLLHGMETKYQVSLLQSYYRWRRSIVNKGYDVDSNRHRQLAYFGLWKIGVMARYFHALQNYAQGRKAQKTKAECFYKRLLAQKTFLALISNSLNNKVMVEGNCIKDWNDRELHDYPQVLAPVKKSKSLPRYILTMGAWIETLESRAERYYERKLLVRIFHHWLVYFYATKIASQCNNRVAIILSSRMLPGRVVRKEYYETSVEVILPVIRFDQVVFRSQRSQMIVLWKMWIRGIEDIRECKYLWATSWKSLMNRGKAPLNQLPLKSSWVKASVQRRQQHVLQRWMELRQHRIKQKTWNQMKLVLLDKDFHHRLADRIHCLYLFRMGLKALYDYTFVKMPNTFHFNEDETAILYANEIDRRKVKSRYFAFWRMITKVHKEKRLFAINGVQKQRNLLLWTKAKWALQHYVMHIRYSEIQIRERTKRNRQAEIFQILQRYFKFRSNYSCSLVTKVSRCSLRVGGLYDVRRTISNIIHVFRFPWNNIERTKRHSDYIVLWNKLLLGSSAFRALRLHRLQRLGKEAVLSLLVALMTDDLKRLSFYVFKTIVTIQQRRTYLHARAVEFNQRLVMNRAFVTWRRNIQWIVAERQATQVAMEFSRHKTLYYWMPKWRNCIGYRKRASEQISNKQQRIIRKLCFMLWRVETLAGIYSIRARRRPIRRVFRAFHKVLEEESKQRKQWIMSRLQSDRIFETHLRRMMDGATFCVYRSSRKMDVYFHLDEHLEFLYSTRKEFCFSLASVIELEYGMDSTTYSEYLEIVHHEPWQCFSIHLRNTSQVFCLATDNERILETWFLGFTTIVEILQRRTRKPISLRAMRGRMKLRQLCNQNNSSLAKILLDKYKKSPVEHSLVSEAPLDMPSKNVTLSMDELHYQVVAQALHSPELLIQELNQQLLNKESIQVQGHVSLHLLSSGKMETNKCNQYQAEEIQSWLQADARILRVSVQCDIVPVQEPYILEDEQTCYLSPVAEEDLSPLPEDEPISLALSKTISRIPSGRIPSLVPFARVRLIVPGSPCNAAGLMEDDYILSIGRLRFYRDSRGIPFVVGCNITLENISRWVEKICYQHENGTLQLVVLRRFEFYPDSSSSEQVIEEWRTLRLQLLPKASPRYHGLLGATFDFEVLKQQFQEPSNNIPFAMVTQVLPGSPAAEAGFLVNDLILEYGSICFSAQDHYENAPQYMEEYWNNTRTQESIVVVVLRSNNHHQDLFNYDAPLCMYRLLLTPNFHWQGVYGMQWSFFLSPGVIGYMDNGETVYHTSRWLWAKWMLKTIKKVKVLLKPDDMIIRCRVLTDFFRQIAADSKLAGIIRVYKKVDKYACFQCPLPCYEHFCKYIQSNEHLELVIKQKETSSQASSSCSNQKVKKWKWSLGKQRRN